MQFEASLGKQTQGVMTMFDSPEPKTNKTNNASDSKKQQTAKVVKKQ